jgi:hypothetical protein
MSLEKLLLMSVVAVARCVLCKRVNCDAVLWAPDNRTVQAVHARCLRAP